MLYKFLLAICTGFLAYYSARDDKRKGSRYSVSTICWGVACVLWLISALIKAV